MKTHKKFTPQERDLLATHLASGISKTECARRLGRPRRSVLREISSNGSWVKDQYGKMIFIYVAISAQVKAQRRQQNSAHNKQPLKNPKVYRYVAKHLRKGWSPEAIAGRLKKSYPNDDSWHICHETIYEWIFDQPPDQNGKQWFEYLRRKQKKRKRQKGRTVHQSHIPDRISISQRPQEVNNREEFGHWEVDCVEGKAHKKGIHTFLERKTRYYQAILLENIDSEFGVEAQMDTFKKLPLKARKSATFDNGRENFNHTKLKIHLGMKTYFCDPNAAWQKGANEHFNGVLRRYIPKKTDLRTITQFELDAIIEEINGRPLKCLKYETPSEAFKRELKSIIN